MRVGRQVSPSTTVIDSQSVKTVEAGGPRRYDAGKKTKGRKRHPIATRNRGRLKRRFSRSSILDYNDYVVIVALWAI